MKQTILSLAFLLLFLSNGSLLAQDVSLSDKSNYQIEKVYPNPVRDFVFVEVNSQNYTSIQFEAIDILGNKIKQWKKEELVPGNQRIRLDLQSFHPGFYLLKVVVDGQVTVKRIRKL